MYLFQQSTSILEDLQNLIAALFVSIDWDIILFVGIAFEVLFAIFYIIKSRFSYEVRVVKNLLKLNNWLNKNRLIDQTNLIEFNNMMKRTPKHLRYYWHEYMLNREKEPSYYMSTYNLVEKPLKSSSYHSNLKNFKITSIVMAGLLFLFSVLKISTVEVTFGTVGLCIITPVLMLLIYSILSVVMRANQNVFVNSLFQYVHYFGRFLDRAVTTMPDYVDFEVLFTHREIKKGIPVLNEYLEKRARQEQEELEKARMNAVEHETYDFSSTGINGSLVLDRAINESETYINVRSRLFSEIQQLEDEIESIKRTYENAEKDYQKKLQVSKENVDRLRKQQEETTNRIENNYIKKQQADEIKKQEQLEKDHDASTIRFNQELEALTAEITTRKTELEERRKYVEEAMKAEYQTFSTKLYKSLTAIIKEEHEDEKSELIEMKDEIAQELQKAHDDIAHRDREIEELQRALAEHQIDYDERIGFGSEKLRKESKKKKRGKKRVDEKVAVQQVQKQDTRPLLAPNVNFANDPNLIPLDQIAEKDKQYGDDGGFYDPNGYYRYPNGTYFTPNSEFHDEYGGWFEADGVTYHSPEEVAKAAQPQQNVVAAQPQTAQFAAGLAKMNAVPENERKYTKDGCFYDKDGFYYYPNGTYYTPDGKYFDEFGGWFEADGVTYHAPGSDDDNQDDGKKIDVPEEMKSVLEGFERMQAVPEEEREYTADGGFFDKDGYYYYPNGTYFTPDGRYFDENGGWFEADGVTYHPNPKLAPPPDDDGAVLEKAEGNTQPENSQSNAQQQEEDLPQEAVEEMDKLRQQFNLDLDAEEQPQPTTPEPESAPQETIEEFKFSAEDGLNEPVPTEELVQEEPAQQQEQLLQQEQEEQPVQENNELPEDLFEPEPEQQPVHDEPAISQQKKRGRKPKSTTPTIQVFETAVNDEPISTAVLFADDIVEEEQPQAKRRGRPKKQTQDFDVAQDFFEPAQEPKRGRGRPKKQAEQTLAVEEEVPQPKRRGRPKKEIEQPMQAPVTEKKRGRPKKAQEELQPQQAENKRGRGRPKKSVESKNEEDYFGGLMASPQNSDLDELDKLNEKIASENKKLAEHQEEFDKQLTDALFSISGEEDK